MASPAVALNVKYVGIWNLIWKKNVKYHINNFCVFITYFNDTGYIRLHKYIIKVNLIFFTFINVAIRELKLQSGLPSSLGHAHLLSLEFAVLVLL